MHISKDEPNNVLVLMQGWNNFMFLWAVFREKKILSLQPSINPTYVLPNGKISSRLFILFYMHFNVCFILPFKKHILITLTVIVPWGMWMEMERCAVVGLAQGRRIRNADV